MMDPLVLTILFIGKNLRDFLDKRKVNFALVLRSDKEMSITFGWWRAEMLKHLGKFIHCLIFLRAAACIFLMADLLP